MEKNLDTTKPRYSEYCFASPVAFCYIEDPLYCVREKEGL